MQASVALIIVICACVVVFLVAVAFCRWVTSRINSEKIKLKNELSYLESLLEQLKQQQKKTNST